MQMITYPVQLRQLGDMTLIQKDIDFFEITNTQKISLVFTCVETATKEMLYIFYDSIDSNNRKLIQQLS